jgi:4-amino-4-deoxy-L-arabinose transferase-like glycosyltransferase
VLVALLVRGAALYLGRDAEPWNDQVTYVQRAEDLLDGKGYTGSYQSWVRHPGERQLQSLPRYRGAYQAPGYPAFVALVMALCGRDVLWVKAAQVLLGAATAYLLYALGRSWYGHAAGLAAGWFFALDPTLVAFTHYVFTETLFVFLFVAAASVAFRRRELSGPTRALAAGVLFAAAAYVKSSVIFLLPVLAAWFVWVHRESAARAARWAGVAALAWALCVAPWTVRNWRVHGGFVLMDSSGAYNFWRGNQPNAYARRRANSDWNVRFAAPFEAYSMAPVSEVGGSTFVQYAAEAYATPTPTDLQVIEAGGRAALDYIRDEPAWFLRRAWYKIVDLWNPTSFVMRHLEKQGYGEIPGWVETSLSWAAVLSYLATLAFALPALWALRRDPYAQLVLLLILYYTAVHAVTFGLTRFRLPVMPFLDLLAGYGAARWLGGAARGDVARA